MIYLGLGILLQTVLFLVKWTNIFQPSDLWNNYSYIVWGAMVIYATDNFLLGIACMVLLNLYSLLISELIAKRWSAYYGYPHCTIIAMHNVEPAVFAVLIDPVLNLFRLDKVNLNPKAIEKKIGVFGEPMVIGLFIGMLIGIIGSIGHLDSLKTWGQIFYVAVSAGFAIPAGAALITSFNILGKPMLGLVFLAFLSQNPFYIGISVAIYAVAYAAFRFKRGAIEDYMEKMANRNTAVAEE